MLQVLGKSITPEGFNTLQESIKLTLIKRSKVRY